jgi:hypothetical protein
MKKFVPRVAFLAILLILVIIHSQVQAQPPRIDSPGEEARPVPDFFFGMTFGLIDRWPVVPFYNVRLHDTRTGWAILNPSDGVYDWTSLDRWMEGSQQHGAGPMLYTFSQTPQWASSNPNDRTCRYGPGECDPPNDLNPDGTGTNQHWKDFVSALARHAAGPTKIRFWEMWNEPRNTFYWTGTAAQLVRMAKDARTIILNVDPKAKLLTPPEVYASPYYEKWWKAYADAGGLQYADILAVHGGIPTGPPTCGKYPLAADFLDMIENFKVFLKGYGVNKPIWDTEEDWGNTERDCFTDLDLQSAFLAQVYVFHRSAGVRRLFWYVPTGKLFDLKTGAPLKPGIAYEQVHGWMMGNALANGCSATGTMWTCSFTGPNGYQSETVWDTSETCGHGVCQTVPYAVDPSYTQYRTLSGDTIAITNHEVPIGAKPILLENKPR